MGDVVYFNQEIKNLLVSALNPRTQTEGRASSPHDLVNDEMRIDAGTNPVEWLRGIARKTKYPELLRMTDNIAVTAEIRWESTRSGKQVLVEAHCQAIVVQDETIKNVLKGKSAQHTQYLRADFEPWNLGNYVFPDPLSHVHANQKGEPRFALSASATTTHIDFFELVLRNYARDVWQAWAEDVWRTRVRPIPQGSGLENLMSAIRSAFGENEYTQLCTDPLRSAVLLWRKALRREKGRMTSIVPNETLTPINY